MIPHSSNSPSAGAAPATWRARPVDWAVGPGLTDYAGAVDEMEARAAAIAEGCAPELIWLVEHPPVYTAGTSAAASELLQPDRFPVLQTGRGGRFTYHGPGQRVIYVMLNVKQRGGDVRAFVAALEAWIIDALAAFGIRAVTRQERVGIWVPRPAAHAEDKIAAIGLRLRKWVSLHGIALNVDPDLSHYEGIVPCGIAQHGVTSLAALGVDASFESVDNVLRTCFVPRFGPMHPVRFAPDNLAVSSGVQA